MRHRHQPRHVQGVRTEHAVGRRNQIVHILRRHGEADIPDRHPVVRQQLPVGVKRADAERRGILLDGAAEGVRRRGRGNDQDAAETALQDIVVPLLHRLQDHLFHFGAVRGIAEPLKEGIITLLLHAGRKRRAERCGARGIRIDVVRAACLADHFRGIADGAPVAAADRLVVRDVHRKPAGAGGVDGLLHALPQHVPLIADVRGVDCACSGDGTAQRLELFGICKGTRRVHQARGEPERPGLHRFPQQAAHGVQFFFVGRLRAQTHRGEPQRAVRREQRQVDPGMEPLERLHQRLDAGQLLYVRIDRRALMLIVPSILL